MATAAQIEANRRNARMSTGPKSAAGKARASLNSLKHGRAGQGRRAGAAPGRPQRSWTRRSAGGSRTCSPWDDPERDLVVRAARLSWTLDRAERCETAGLAVRVRAGPAPVERGDRREGLRPGPEAAVQRGAADPARLRAPLGRQPGRLPVRARVDRRGLPLAAGAVDGARRHARARGHLDAHRPVPVDPAPGQAPGRRDQRPGPQPPDPGLGDGVAGGGDRLLGAVLPPDAEGGPGVPGVHGVARDRRQAGRRGRGDGATSSG